MLLLEAELELLERDKRHLEQSLAKAKHELSKKKDEVKPSFVYCTTRYLALKLISTQTARLHSFTTLTRTPGNM